MSRRAVCARLEAPSLPCCCRRRAALCLRARASISSSSSPTRAHISEGRPAHPRRSSRSSPGRSSSTSCWAFRRAARQSSSFLDVFRRSNKFSEVQAVCRSLGDSPLVGLFQAGYAELTAQLRQSTPRRRPAGSNPAGAPPTSYSEEPDGRRSRADARVGRRGEQAREAASRFSRRRRASTPFIGLFGTVWGIMMAFQSIGADRLDQSRRGRRPASPKR